MPGNQKRKKQSGYSRGRKTGVPRGGYSKTAEQPKKASRPSKPAKAARLRPTADANAAAPSQPEIATIQWFPGHMARTRRKIKESIALVDAVVEVVDARIPMASRNPELDSLTEGKPRLVILNKADLADEAMTCRWIAWFQAQGITALAMDCKSGRGFNRFLPALRERLRDLVEKWESRGMNRCIRVMVVGIPNVGKSSFINRINRGGKAKVEDRPGVTRMNQWFVAEDGTQLLDTPGVLWPKFDDQYVAMRLAFTGAIKDGVLDMEEMACELLKLLHSIYPSLLQQRYGLPQDMPSDAFELLKAIGRRRGMLLSGGEIDTLRAAIMLLDEYRGGKLGRISLETPAQEVDSRA